MDWALAQHDPLNWRGGRDDAVIATNDGAFKHHLDRMKYPHRYNGVDTAHYYRQGVAILGVYEALLSEHRFLHGDHTSFTDIAIFPFVRQFARADLASWRQNSLPRTRNWLETLTQSPLFENVMAKHELWTELGEPTTVPL
jgi:glutathione S-transferase